MQNTLQPSCKEGVLSFLTLVPELVIMTGFANSLLLRGKLAQA